MQILRAVILAVTHTDALKVLESDDDAADETCRRRHFQRMPQTSAKCACSGWSSGPDTVISTIKATRADSGHFDDARLRVTDAVRTFYNVHHDARCPQTDRK